MRDLTNQVVIVTGASRGIGAAAAEKLAAYGAKLVLIARSEGRLKDMVERITDTGGDACFFQADVADFEAMQNAVTFCIERYGRLDVLVNNAGVIEPIARLADSDPTLWAQAVDINLKGVYHGVRSCLPVMLKQGAGTIINLSSGAATGQLEGWSHYCATKAAVKQLTECTHLEYSAQGITSVGLSPGTVATDMMNTIKQSGINRVSQLDWSVHIPPEWVGEAIAFLCTDEAKAFSGTDFTIKTEEGRRLVGLDARHLPG